MSKKDEKQQHLEDILLGGAIIEGLHAEIALKHEDQSYVWHVHYDKGRMVLTNHKHPYSQGTVTMRPGREIKGKAIGKGAHYAP